MNKFEWFMLGNLFGQSSNQREGNQGRGCGTLIIVGCICILIGIKSVSEHDRNVQNSIMIETLTLTTSVSKSYDAGKIFKNEAMSVNEATSIVNGEIDEIKTLLVKIKKTRHVDYQLAVEDLLEGVEKLNKAIEIEDFELAKESFLEQQANLKTLEKVMHEEVERETLMF